MNRLIVVLIIGMLAATGVAAWMWMNRQESNELLLGGYIEAEQVQVGSKLGGRVARVLVKEGSRVEAGEDLVIFETDDVEAQLREAKAELTRAREKLNELHAGTRPEEKDQARAVVKRLKDKWTMLKEGPRLEEREQARLMFERSKAEYDNAKSNYERVVALAERNAAAKDALDNARKALDTSMRAMQADEQHYIMLQRNRQEEVDMAEHELEEAQASLELALNGPRAEEIRQAQAVVDVAQARIDRLEVLLREGTVKAPPFPCVVESFYKSSGVQPGDLVAAGATLATLVGQGQYWVRAFVPETDLGHIRNDDKVDITVDSFPGRRFAGIVLRVNRIAEFTPRNIQTFKERQDMMFPVKVQVDDPEGVLRPGMAATVHVPITADSSAGLTHPDRS
jgi:membrane fusion protein YbhG